MYYTKSSAEPSVMNCDITLNSFYKEEFSGDKRNYINNRARSERKDVLQVLAEVEQQSIMCQH